MNNTCLSYANLDKATSGKMKSIFPESDLKVIEECCKEEVVTPSMPDNFKLDKHPELCAGKYKHILFYYIA